MAGHTFGKSKNDANIGPGKDLDRMLTRRLGRKNLGTPEKRKPIHGGNNPTVPSTSGGGSTPL